MGRLVENCGGTKSFEGLKSLHPRNTLSREKTLKVKVMCRKPSCTQRSNGGTGSRQRNHQPPFILYTPYQGIPRVGNQRRPRVADERNGLTRINPADQPIHHMGVAVFMKTNEWRRDIVLRHECTGVTRILCRNQIDSFQRLNCSERYVTRIPDRRGHNIQCSFQFLVLSVQSGCMIDPTPTVTGRPLHDGTFSGRLHKWALSSLVCLHLAACTTAPSVDVPSTKGAISDYPIPTQRKVDAGDTPDTRLDHEAVLWAQKIAAERGWLFALAELEALEEGLISANTERFIRSQLLWLKGDTTAANTQLSEVVVSGKEELDLLLAERQRRAFEAGEAVASAKIALERLQLGYEGDNATTYSAVFDLLSAASEQQIAAELRKTEPNSDWAAWLSLNRAYRKGRDEVMSWRQSHPILPNGLLSLPSGLQTWLESDLPSRVAVLLPLSGRLKDAGEGVLEGITEGLYASYRDSALRPQLITIDTEAAGSGNAAYLAALERGADFVVGPLTKERVAELQSAETLPIPVLALNRGATVDAVATPTVKQLLSLSLAPEDEAIQLASMVWQEGLRKPLVIMPESAWGNRMYGAFSRAWESLGGDVRALTILSDEVTDNETVATSLATLQSESRIKEVEKAFEAPVDAQTRRRTDLDAVILLVPTPQMAREIRPLLRFHYAGKLPVYAPSTIYQPESGIANRDLNGIRFVLTPNAFAADRKDSTQLHALGLDAAAFIDHFYQAEQTRGTLLFGATGYLSADNAGNIRRRLKPAIIARGKARAI